MIGRNTFILIFILNLLIPLALHGQASQKKITPAEYIEKYKVIAIKKRLEYKIPASITLAQGLLESGNGNSPLAVNANNHFGIKCHKGWTGKTYHQDDDAKDECFRKYDNPAESFEDHSLFLTTRSRYNFLFNYDVTEYKKWAKGLKKAGYATNPSYAHLLIDLIERYDLHTYDTMTISEAKKGNKKSVSHEIIAGNANIRQEINHENKNQFAEVKDPGEAKVGTNELMVKRKNRIKYVIARKGDNPDVIAEELDMWTWQIRKYNELDGKRTIDAGDIVYLQPKRRKGSEKYHTVQEGETMYEISQKYGIKLKHIYKKNHMEEGTEPNVGQKLWLRRKKPQN
ncbi:MAG: glucosaminidase domain-containing protein [Bacteroidales bacterium]|nr:glucosaminidase domain-containing protein [Bacteroidales bacterium]